MLAKLRHRIPPIGGLFLLAALAGVSWPVGAQRGGMFLGSANDPRLAAVPAQDDVR